MHSAAGRCRRRLRRVLVHVSGGKEWLAFKPDVCRAAPANTVFAKTDDLTGRCRR
jgi:hypothetical protein